MKKLRFAVFVLAGMAQVAFAGTMPKGWLPCPPGWTTHGGSCYTDKPTGVMPKGRMPFPPGWTTWGDYCYK